MNTDYAGQTWLNVSERSRALGPGRLITDIPGSRAMDVLDRIKEQVDGNPIIIYMKGTPQFPQCGFSARTVEALKTCNRRFAFVNVLADPEIFENLPRFQDWPTFPQVYVDGELIGGCDITLELAESGELEKMVHSAAEKWPAGGTA